MKKTFLIKVVKLEFFNDGSFIYLKTTKFKISIIVSSLHIRIFRSAILKCNNNITIR